MCIEKIYGRHSLFFQFQETSSQEEQKTGSPSSQQLNWLGLVKLTLYTVTLRSVYAFDNCILRSGPGDNAHVDIGDLYMEFTNP
jgi:hypothetical protein